MTPDDAPLPAAELAEIREQLDADQREAESEWENDAAALSLVAGPVGYVPWRKGHAIDAPFVWFGGKSRAAALIWERFGDVRNYVEPFFGSGAVLLGRPTEPGIETVNDLDCFVVNAYRAIHADPNAVASFCDWPVTEADLSARHLWLVAHREDLALHIQGDPEYFDVKVAGWWLHGIACWIGSGWCSGNGPWISVDGRLTDSRTLDGEHLTENGVTRKRPFLDNTGGGIGVNRPGLAVERKRPQLGKGGHGVAAEAVTGVNRQMPFLSAGVQGQGVNRQLPRMGPGRGVERKALLYDWMRDLCARLRRVRITCGDWTRILGPSVTTANGLTAILLDPPYSDEERTSGLYRKDSGTVAAEVRAWAIKHGDDPMMRIALCGYSGEHDMPGDWESVEWKANGGYGNQGEENDNRHRETVWFSPNCLQPVTHVQEALW